MWVIFQSSSELWEPIVFDKNVVAKPQRSPILFNSSHILIVSSGVCGKKYIAKIDSKDGKLNKNNFIKKLKLIFFLVIKIKEIKKDCKIYLLHELTEAEEKLQI